MFLSMRETRADDTPATFHTMLPRAVVAITGADRVGFLQGLISQDAERVDNDRAAYGTLLTPQGKFLHDFFLVARNGAILMDCERERADDLVSRLSRFRLRAKVEIAVDTGLSIAAVAGTDAGERFALSADEGAAAQMGDCVAFIDPRTPRLGVRLVGPAKSLETLLSDRGIPPGPFEAYDRLRIACAAPDGSRDMEVEKSTLLESNIDLLNGIDWDKGCYMGQELTARTKYRGLVKRRLAAFRATSDDQVPGVPVYAGGKQVGEIRSRAGDRVLASVRLETDDGAAPPLEAGGAPIEPLIEG